MNYPGGKNGPGIYQTIINQIPAHTTYIEPFAGSAAIYRHKRLARVSYLIDRDAPAATALQAMIDVDYRRFGLSSRGGDHDGSLTDDRSIAGELACGDLIGKSAVVSSSRRSHLQDLDGALTGGRRRLVSRQSPASPTGGSTDATGVVVICADATRWLKSYDWRDGEFVYADPPYLAATRRGAGRQLYRHDIRTEEEHELLLDVLAALPCPVMISGYWSELYGRRLDAWRVIRFQSMTRGGKQMAECLWMNYNEPLQLHDYSYLGRNNRERQDLKRMRERWVKKLEAMPLLKRQALLSALQALDPGQLPPRESSLNPGLFESESRGKS